MDSKKIDEFTTMLHKCVSDRDEARKAQLKAEDFEGQWQFSKDCDAIMSGDMTFDDICAKEKGAQLEDNLHLINQCQIERKIDCYVVKMNKLVDDLRTELKGQRRTYEAGIQIVNGTQTVDFSNYAAHKLIKIHDLCNILHDHDYAERLNIIRDGYIHGARNANNGDVGFVIGKLDNEEICAVRLIKDQSVIIIRERGCIKISS
jgi:hypothetical protein